MKNYFGISLIIWALLMIISIIFTWNMIQQEINSLLITQIDKRFFFTIFNIIFNPFYFQFTWYLWFIAGFIGGLLIREPRDGIFLNIFSISSFYLIYLIYQIQFNIFMGFSLIGLLIFMLISSFGGLLGGLIHRDNIKTLEHKKEASISSLSTCTKCGQTFDSNPLLCSYCGSEISKKKESIISN
ncbi:MAG: hypothetical protein EAX96_18275 [Candidatus Lokiarchaeota archaeon]|nr:hypothetical protein [Candidatus Lokiarchaeota archaeon]